jgi:hypothetical protein
MKRRKRIKWSNGDLFAVPLVDGTFGLVQAVDHWLPHWIYTGVTDHRFTNLPSDVVAMGQKNVIARIAVSDDAFDFGDFMRLGHAEPLARRKDFANEQFASNGYIGAVSYTAGILVDFLSAWHAISPWNQYKDSDYFDKLLAKGIKRPDNVIMKNGS